MMESYLNRRLVSNPPSGIRRIGQIAKSIPGCIALTIGEPDFDAPVAIRESIAAAIAGGDTHYPPNAGYGEWLDQIAGHLNNRFGCDYSQEEILCTVGSTQALASALFAVLNPGDEVIVFTPCFGLYKPQIEMAGGVCVEMDISKDSFAVTREALKKHMTERTRVILFASPNNPNGEVLDSASLAVLKEAALAHDLFLIADSVYDRLVYGESMPTLMGDAQLRDRLIYVSALSKSYAMTGVRVGYAAADAPVMAQMLKAHSFSVVSIPGCIQRGCEGVFDLPIDDMLSAYRARRDYVVSRLDAMGLDVRLPGGAFYTFPSIKRFGMTSDEFATRFLMEEKVAVVPGTAFGDCGEGFLRISYAYSIENLKVAIGRLADFVARLRVEKQ